MVVGYHPAVLETARWHLGQRGVPQQGGALAVGETADPIN